MIYGVFGLPGSGKTTFLTKCAVRSLQGKSPFRGLPASKTVYSTVDIPGTYKLDFDKLGVYDFRDCLIIIDEIMLFADCRNFKNFNDDLKYFFSHHRHYGIDIIWCSQSWDDCDKKIRGLTDTLFLLEPWWFGCSVAKPIVKSIGVVENKMQDTFNIGGLLSWSWIYRKRYYKYFDSFVQKPLKEFQPELWAPFPSFPSFRDKLHALGTAGARACKRILFRKIF